MTARKLLVAAMTLLLTTPAWAEDLTESEDGSGEKAAARVSADGTVIRGNQSSRWRGSWISYDHVHSTIGFDKGAELMWNPYYAHSLSLAPRYTISDEFFVSAGWSIEQELTNSDWTNRKNELMWSDVSLTAGWIGWAESFTGIRVTPTLRLALPVSKVSAAQTQLLAVTPSVRLSRNFDVLGGLYVAWSGTWTQRFHEETTARKDASGVVGCESAETCPDAERLANTGYLNAWGDLSTGPSMVLTLAPGLRFNADMRWTKAYVYDNAEGTFESMGQERTAGSSAQRGEYVGRYGTYFGMGMSYDLLNSVTLTGAVYTPSPQLAPNGERRSPFFNRYTRVGVSLGIDIDSFYQTLVSGS